MQVADIHKAARAFFLKSSIPDIHKRGRHCSYVTTIAVKTTRARTFDQLRGHLADFLAAYNFAKRLETLAGLTPHECVCKIWTENPKRFKKDPTHHTSGLYC